MKKVQPIRDREKISQMKIELKKNGTRDYMLFTFGINIGLRISDILNLKVSDVKNKTHINLVEIKTGKGQRLIISTQVKSEINEYITGMKDDEYLFQSRKGVNKPISRIQAYRILNDAAIKVGLEEVGTHTLRKTFGYWHYQIHKDVATLQEIFNHSSPSITLRYIGITDDMKDATMKDFYL